MSDVDVRRFKAAFLKAMSESDSSDAPSAGISIVPLQQARLAWSTARGAVADELGRLDAELRKAFPDAGKLFDRLDGWPRMAVLLLYATGARIGWACPRCDMGMRLRSVVLHPPDTRAPPPSTAHAG